MNETANNFIEELKSREDVLGIILFGSWARGNNRPDSDIDLVVILDKGYQRTIENRDGQIFEIIFSTRESVLEYWKSNRDDCAGLWEVAKILYDKDGIVKELQSEVSVILKEGKKSINKLQLEQFRFDAEDQVKVSGLLFDKDSTTANFILTNKVFALTSLFFNIRQLWIPAPKQRLGKIKEIKPALHSALQDFYREGETFKNKLEIAKKIIDLVFEI
jgi:predicted nucleotidyltransferase